MTVIKILKEHIGSGNSFCKGSGAGVSLGRYGWSSGLNGKVRADRAGKELEFHLYAMSPMH